MTSLPVANKLSLLKTSMNNVEPLTCWAARFSREMPSRSTPSVGADARHEVGLAATGRLRRKTCRWPPYYGETRAVELPSDFGHDRTGLLV
jgi:hypothetical protein